MCSEFGNICKTPFAKFLLVAREPMNGYPGLKFNQSFSFQLLYRIIFSAIFVEFEIIRFKSEGQKCNQKPLLKEM